MAQYWFVITIIAVVGFTASQNCPEKFKAVSASHTACKPDATGISNRGVSIADRNLILRKHNELRGTVHNYGQPKATNMMKVYWDEEVAMVAQKLADSCKLGSHDKNSNRNIPGRMTLGQNLANGQSSWNEAIMDWFNEYKDFAYNIGSKNNKPTGHYTQIVWAETTRIGCGFTQCPNGKSYVCNYGPAGNLNGGRKPYETGQTVGASCPKTLTNGVCDCKKKICLNSGKMNPNTCQCTCLGQKQWFRQPDCGIECNKAKDTFACKTNGGIYGVEECRLYSNVPGEYCPITCKTCPAGDISKQKEGGAATTGPSTGGNKQTKPVAPPVAPPVTPHVVGSGNCQLPDAPKCGLPGVQGGFYTSSYCKYYSIKKMCPVMCKTCKAPACDDGTGRRMSKGQTWIFGSSRVACNSGGYLILEKGCQVLGTFLPGGQTLTIGGTTCQCWTSGNSVSASCLRSMK